MASPTFMWCCNHIQQAKRQVKIEVLLGCVYIETKWLVKKGENSVEQIIDIMETWKILAFAELSLKNMNSSKLACTYKYSLNGSK